MKVAFDPAKAAVSTYPISSYQPLYFVADSFRTAQEQVRQWAAQNLTRPFAVRYNPYTAAIDILDSREKIARSARDVKAELEIVIEALSKIA